MNTEELQKLAKHARSMREMGTALLAASILLALFLFVPTKQVPLPSPDVTTVPSPAPDAFAQLPLEAKAAIVYDLATDKTLFEKNADAQLPLASLTKLLTVYAAYSTLSGSTPITIPANSMRLEGPHAFSVGQTFTLDDLSRLTLTASLNDGAVAIANATAERENVPESEMLAAAVTALKLSQTFAINGSGLDVSNSISGGYGSARDLARLAGEIVKIAPGVAEATTRSSAEATSVGGTAFRVLNTDPMVSSMPHLLLSKTGYTDLAGGNLALVFDVGINHPVAVIVLGSSQKARFTDGTMLIAATLAHFAGVQSL